MFDESRNNNPYTESVREEFCSACALHGLIEREHVERILGESSMSYEPSQEKYSKEKLVQSCLSDPDKIQALVRDMDKMDGNVGAVCQALVEVCLFSLSPQVIVMTKLGEFGMLTSGGSCCGNFVTARIQCR
jgi:mediator of RNA polymerase II transcription subunit 5